MFHSPDPVRRKHLASEHPDPEAFKAVMCAHFEALEPHITAELRGIYELLGVLLGALEVNDLQRLQQHPHVDREFFAANMLFRAPRIEEIPEMLTWIRDPDERRLLEFAYLYPYQHKTMSIHDFACLWNKGWKVADFTETDDEMQVLKRWQSDVMELIFHNLTVHFTLEERVLEKWFLEDGSHELGTGFEAHMDEAIEMLVIKCLASDAPNGKQVFFNDAGTAIDVLMDLANRTGIAEWVPDLIEWQPEPEAHRILLDLYKWGNVLPLLLQLGLFHTEEEIWSRLRTGV